MRSFALLSLLFLVSVSLSTSAWHGNSCTSAYDCLEPGVLPGVATGLICRNYKCVCQTGRVWDNNLCQPFSSGKCYYNNDCQDIDSNRTCNKTTNRCVCKNFTYENADGLCKLAYNLTCQSNGNCFGFNCTKQTNKSKIITGNDQFTGKCRCPVGTLFNNQTMKCIDFNWSYCYSNSSCQDADPNRICISTDCICRRGTFVNQTTRWCQIQKGHNETCQSNQECLGSMRCKHVSWNNNRCRCPIGYIWSNTSKDCVPFLLGNCTQDIDCRDVDPTVMCIRTSFIFKHNKTIVRNQCQCPPGISTNSSGFCSSGQNRGQTCIWTSDCRKNMTCESIYQSTCKCQVGFVWSRLLGKCIRFKDGNCLLDEDCQDQDPNFECAFNKGCVCKQGYKFKDNKCFPKLYSSCITNSECPISGSVCNKDLKMYQCTCQQTQEPTEDRLGCRLRTCFSSCSSPDYMHDSRMECNIGTCLCKSSMDYVTGACRAEPIDYGYNSGAGAFWVYVFLPMIIVLSIMTLVFRLLRLSQLNSERRRLENCHPASVAIVSTHQYNQSPDFVAGDRPPQYSEVRDLPPSYSRSVNGK